MGIDKIFTIPIPFSILLNDSVLYRFSYRFSFGEKKGQQTGRLASSLFRHSVTLVRTERIENATFRNRYRMLCAQMFFACWKYFLPLRKHPRCKYCKLPCCRLFSWRVTKLLSACTARAPCLLSTAGCTGVATQRAWWRHSRPLESIRESFAKLANGSKESKHWEPVLNKNRFSIPIPSCDRVSQNTLDTLDLKKQTVKKGWMKVNLLTDLVTNSTLNHFPPSTTQPVNPLGSWSQQAQTTVICSNCQQDTRTINNYKNRWIVDSLTVAVRWSSNRTHFCSSLYSSPRGAYSRIRKTRVRSWK